MEKRWTIHGLAAGEGWLALTTHIKIISGFNQKAIDIIQCLYSFE
jgi:hypothetical protein